jgi:hypothetical protein
VSDHNETQTSTAAPAPSLPDPDLRVDFGAPAPGSTNPMPIGRRNAYEARIRNSVDAQAAGAEKASQLFIR